MDNSVLSARYSNLPFKLINCLPKFVVTVPDFGDGIKPFGPNTLPNLANLGINWGVVIKRSKSKLPAVISSSKSSEPATDAPNFSASST